MKLDDRVRKIIADQLDLDPAEIPLEAGFLEDLGADSLDVVELVMSMEDEFKISIPDEEVEGIKTVQDAIDYIQRETGKKN